MLLHQVVLSQSHRNLAQYDSIVLFHKRFTTKLTRVVLIHTIYEVGQCSVMSGICLCVVATPVSEKTRMSVDELAAQHTVMLEVSK